MSNLFPFSICNLIEIVSTYFLNNGSKTKVFLAKDKDWSFKKLLIPLNTELTLEKRVNEGEKMRSEFLIIDADYAENYDLFTASE